MEHFIEWNAKELKQNLEKGIFVYQLQFKLSDI